jgi:hypothetical protein
MYLRVACLAVMATLLSPSLELAEANRAGRADNESGWVTFNGTAKKDGQKYRLTAADKNGAIDAPVEGVSVDGITVKIKVGTTIRVVKEAKGTPDPGSKPPEGCIRRTCVGQVLICCNDARVVSACTGSFSCN